MRFILLILIFGAVGGCKRNLGSGISAFLNDDESGDITTSEEADVPTLEEWTTNLEQETAVDPDQCSAEEEGLSLQANRGCAARRAVTLSPGLFLAERSIQAAAVGALAAALDSVRAEILAADLRVCQVGDGLEAEGCFVGGRGSIAQGVVAVAEGTALGNGFKAETTLQLDSMFNVRITMNEAQRGVFLASKEASGTNPTFAAGTRVTLTYRKSVRNTARMLLKLGAEILGVGGNIQLGGDLGVASSSDIGNTFRLSADLALNDLTSRLTDTSRLIIDRQADATLEIYGRLLAANAAAILAWVNEAAVGSGSQCGRDIPERALATWERTALCKEGYLCCQGSLLYSSGAYCYVDNARYRGQADCQIFGLTR